MFLLDTYLYSFVPWGGSKPWSSTTNPSCNKQWETGRLEGEKLKFCFRRQRTEANILQLNPNCKSPCITSTELVNPRHFMCTRTPLGKASTAFIFPTSQIMHDNNIFFLMTQSFKIYCGMWPLHYKAPGMPEVPTVATHPNLFMLGINLTPPPTSYYEKIWHLRVNWFKWRNLLSYVLQHFLFCLYSGYQTYSK